MSHMYSMVIQVLSPIPVDNWVVTTVYGKQPVVNCILKAINGRHMGLNTQNNIANHGVQKYLCILNYWHVFCPFCKSFARGSDSGANDIPGHMTQFTWRGNYLFLYFPSLKVLWTSVLNSCLHFTHHPHPIAPVTIVLTTSHAQFNL